MYPSDGSVAISTTPSLRIVSVSDKLFSISLKNKSAWKNYIRYIMYMYECIICIKCVNRLNEEHIKYRCNISDGSITLK